MCVFSQMKQMWWLSGWGGGLRPHVSYGWWCRKDYILQTFHTPKWLGFTDISTTVLWASVEIVRKHQICWKGTEKEDGNGWDMHWENNDDIDCIASQLKHNSKHHKATEKEVTKTIPGRELDKQIGMTDSRNSWKKIKAAAQYRTGWRQVACGLLSTLH